MNFCHGGVGVGHFFCLKISSVKLAYSVLKLSKIFSYGVVEGVEVWLDPHAQVCIYSPKM